MEYKKQKGFTIVELMIAITVFSVAVLLVTSGVIQIGREYRHGATKAKINTFTRELHAKFAQEIQYTGEKPSILFAHGGYDKVICMGKTRYLIKFLAQTDPNGDKSLAIDAVSSPGECDIAAVVPANLKYPLPAGTRVTDFDIFEPTGNHSYKLNTRIVIGQQDMFEPTIPNPGGDFTQPCKTGSILGGEFCSVIMLNSDIARKVN